MSWALVHIITRLELGGAQLATLRQVAGSRLPWAERYLVSGEGEQLDAAARALPGVTWVPERHLARRADPRRDAAALAGLVRFLRARKRGGQRLLVHTHSSKAGVLGRLAAFAAGAELVVHSIHGFGHGHHGGWLAPAFLAAERVAARVTHGFTADARANLTQGRREGVVHGAVARWVPCGTDLARFAQPFNRTEERARLGLPEGSKVVLNVACLKPQKDPLTWLRVAAEARKIWPDVVFMWAGDGELREQLERETHRMGLGGCVRWLGWREDVPELMAASDVLLLSSRHEGLPQVLPQAMTAGLPVVATAVDGVPELVQHGQTGWLAPAGDVVGLAAGVREACAARVGHPVRELAKRAAARFDAEQMLLQLDDLYLDLARLRGYAELGRKKKTPSTPSRE